MHHAPTKIGVASKGANMVQKILRLPAVIEATGLSQSTLYAMMAEGKFPRGIPLNKRSVGWTHQEVTAWQEVRIAQRDASIPGEEFGGVYRKHLGARR
jgi:prophage regulatory protein